MLGLSACVAAERTAIYRYLSHERAQIEYTEEALA